jgi:hypothetical protein
MLHIRNARTTRLGSLHELLGIHHELRQVHLLAKLGKPWLDLFVLKAHFMAGVINKRCIEGSALHERATMSQ